MAVFPGFGDWIESELTRRGWSQSEAARRGEISSQSISSVITGTMNPGLDFCRGIARAFHMPLEDVLRLAGILPPKAPSVRSRRIQYRIGGMTMTDRMVELFERLDADQQELVVLLLEQIAGYRSEPRIIGEAPEEGE